MLYQSYPVDLALLGFSSYKERDLTYFHMGEGYLIAIDAANSLHIFSCLEPSPLNMNCRMLANTSMQIPADDKYTVVSAGKLQNNCYFIVVQKEGATGSLVFVSVGTQIYNYASSQKLLTAVPVVAQRDTIMLELVDLALAAITSDQQIVLISYSISEKKFSSKTTAIPKSICPQSLYYAGYLVLYVEGRCQDSQGVYGFDLGDPENKEPVSQRLFETGGKTVKNVCFFDDSVLIARQNDNNRELFLTNLKPDQSRNETFLIEEYGFTGDWTLQCINGNRLFAVQSYDQSSQTWKYGVFDAKSSGKALKRFYSLITDQKFTLLPYSANGDLILAGFQSPGAIFATRTFVGGPKIFVDANGTPAQELSSLQATNANIDTEVPFTVMLTVTDFKKHQIQLPFVSSVVYQSTQLTVKNSTQQNVTTGTVKLSLVASVVGALKSVSIKSKDPKAQETEDVQVIGGLQPRDSTSRDSSGYNLFEFATNVGDNSIIARQSKDETDTFIKTLQIFRFKAGEMVELLTLKTTLVTALDAFRTPKGGVLWSVGCTQSVHTPTEYRLTLWQKDAQSVTTKLYLSPELRKIKVLTTDNSVLILGFAKTGGLTVWSAPVNKPETLPSSPSSRLSQIVDCDAYKASGQLKLVCITNLALEYVTYSLGDDGVVDLSSAKKIAPEYPDPRYMYLSVSAKDSADTLYLVSNTPSAYIVETQVKKKDLTFQQKFHFKVSYHEVASVAYSGSYIVASTYTSRFGLKIHELHSWESAFLLAGNGQLAYSVPLTSPQFTADQPFGYSVPFTTRDNPAGNPFSGEIFSVYMIGTTSRITYWVADQMALNFKSEKVNITSLELQFTGLGGSQSLPLSSMFKSNYKPEPVDPTKPAEHKTSWSWLLWTLVIVTVVLMILAAFTAVVYYKRDDRTVYDRADNQDLSLSKMGETIGPGNNNRD